jgi:hypothetical protein
MLKKLGSPKMLDSAKTQRNFHKIKAELKWIPLMGKFVTKTAIKTPDYINRPVTNHC